MYLLALLLLSASIASANTLLGRQMRGAGLPGGAKAVCEGKLKVTDVYIPGAEQPAGCIRRNGGFDATRRSCGNFELYLLQQSMFSVALQMPNTDKKPFSVLELYVREVTIKNAYCRLENSGNYEGRFFCDTKEPKSSGMVRVFFFFQSLTLLQRASANAVLYCTWQLVQNGVLWSTNQLNKFAEVNFHDQVGLVLVSMQAGNLIIECERVL
ncbi:MAG: hypothetical protein M1829_002672 [Trizodia sp. TS-e1964]|nr:MAG: hypothetical protein M1829_002672 [Trizodia sp. TS-e1964]